MERAWWVMERVQILGSHWTAGWVLEFRCLEGSKWDRLSLIMNMHELICIMPSLRPSPKVTGLSAQMAPYFTEGGT